MDCHLLNLHCLRELSHAEESDQLILRLHIIHLDTASLGDELEVSEVHLIVVDGLHGTSLFVWPEWIHFGRRVSLFSPQTQV